MNSGSAARLLRRFLRSLPECFTWNIERAHSWKRWLSPQAAGAPRCLFFLATGQYPLADPSEPTTVHLLTSEEPRWRIVLGCLRVEQLHRSATRGWGVNAIRSQRLQADCLIRSRRFRKGLLLGPLQLRNRRRCQDHLVSRETFFCKIVFYAGKVAESPVRTPKYSLAGDSKMVALA